MAVSADGPKLCILPPGGLQALLTASGLIRHVSRTHRVLVALEVGLANCLPRLFSGVDVRFWFDDPAPLARARDLGYATWVLPPDPLGMYAVAKMLPSDMHAKFTVHRDTAAEEEVVSRVVDAHGPTFVLVWDAAKGPGIARHFLPEGVSVVDARRVSVANPLDLCGLMQHAVQVHAVDGWFLTLADLVGGAGRRFCHAYAGKTSPQACRKKYRRRVAIVSVAAA